ncbi:MAG: hypothetical protein WAK26_14355 [Terracidiphilus sp.]|jgi:hypothetical protein
MSTIPLAQQKPDLPEEEAGLLGRMTMNGRPINDEAPQGSGFVGSPSPAAGASAYTIEIPIDRQNGGPA